MKTMFDDDFLLGGDTAGRLYHDYAARMPIFDYHCHLSPREVAEDRRFRNLTDAWLGGDHYKWRAMRADGIEERFITGEAGDREKFDKWAGTVPRCIGNPLYAWTHLELARIFGIERFLSPQTAGEIWDRCDALLQADGFSARGLIRRFDVRALCTTDDPADSLEHHRALAGDPAFPVRVLPAFRPDRALAIGREGFAAYVGRLGDAAGVKVRTFEDLMDALERRIRFFHEAGGRLSDHALDPVVFEPVPETEAASAFARALAGEAVSAAEARGYRTRLLAFLGRQYARRGWVMQLHTGALRNVNRRMHRLLGPDTGYDAIGDAPLAEPLAALLDELEGTGELPRTVLYSLHPAAYEPLAALAGCFQGGGVAGRVQLGSAWWFNDQKDGMLRQLTTLANIGLLSRFVGMLTDSRSFLSWPRHEYFRRILCGLIGSWVEGGEAPADLPLLGGMVQDICFRNAWGWFGMGPAGRA